MTASNLTPNARRIARLTGLAYLGIIATGLFAEFFVRMSLVKSGDAAATAANIAGSAGLFRAGLAADATMIALDVAVAIGLYALLRHVNRPLAQLAAALRLLQAAVLGANLSNMASALGWATADASAVNAATSHTLTLSAMELHRVVYDLGLIFFGLACLALGRLMRTSRVVPPILGVGLSIAGAVYLVGSFAVILAPDFAALLEPMYGLTVLAELSVALWLTVKGVKDPNVAKPRAKRSSSAAPRAFLASVVLLSLAACGAADDSSSDTSNNDGSAIETGAQDTPATDPGSEDDPVTLADFGERGRHAVGFRIIEQPDAALTVKAWYPAMGEGDDEIEYEVAFKADYYGAPTGLIRGQARRDAELAEGQEPFPVVIFSHGFSLNPEWYSVLTEQLASRGFVVLAPEHAEGDWDATVLAATLDRPAQVSKTIDLAEVLVAEGDFRRGLDLSRVAVVGHSYGGYTALASAGARFDVEGLAERCSSLSPEDPKSFLCAPFVADDAAQEQLHAASQDETSPLRDDRVAAVVTIAGDAYLFGERGLASVTVPTLAIGGTGDNYSPWDWGAELTFTSVGSERAALVGLEGADHMIAVSTCDDMPFTAPLPEEFSAVLCRDASWDRSDSLAVVTRFTTAFLLDTLTGDVTAAELLARDAVDEARVSYDASW